MKSSSFGVSRQHPTDERQTPRNKLSHLTVCRALVFGIAMAFAADSVAIAQLTIGNAYVTVVDVDGNPLPGVTVTLSGMGAPRTRITNAQGQVRFLGLDDGSYDLEASLDGFRTYERGVDVVINRNTEIDVVLAAAVEDSTEVTSESPFSSDIPRSFIDPRSIIDQTVSNATIAAGVFVGVPATDDELPSVGGGGFLEFDWSRNDGANDIQFGPVVNVGAGGWGVNPNTQIGVGGAYYETDGAFGIYTDTGLRARGPLGERTSWVAEAGFNLGYMTSEFTGVPLDPTKTQVAGSRLESTDWAIGWSAGGGVDLSLPSGRVFTPFFKVLSYNTDQFTGNDRWDYELFIGGRITEPQVGVIPRP